MGGVGGAWDGERRVVGALRCGGVVVWGSCGVGESRCGGVAVWESCGVGELGGGGVTERVRCGCEEWPRRRYIVGWSMFARGIPPHRVVPF